MAKFLQKYLCQKYGIFSLKFHIAKVSSEIEFINLQLVIKKMSCSNKIGPIFTMNWTYILSATRSIYSVLFSYWFLGVMRLVHK